MVEWIDELWELISKQTYSTLIADLSYSGKNQYFKFFMLDDKRYAVLR